ncbi:MAG TPA: hypothetical protein PKJ14_00790 [Candidatus Cloacimonadota bacterium]|nr:hypothetical protein [Candidatus Cloacimonadota bacterium]HQL14179.1 hypothetical protein [Candidatus Cloacimonadota bacterium]
MKFKHLYIPLLILFCAIIFSGSSKNKSVNPPKNGIQLKSGPVTVYTNLDVPAWLLYLPEGDFAIGVAAKGKLKSDKIEKAACSFAANSLAKMHSQFEYSAEDALQYLSDTQQSNSGKPFIVSFNPNPELQKIYTQELKPLAQTDVFGYRLFLMGKGNTELNNDLVRVSAAALPSWCRINKPYSDKGYIFITGTAEDKDLLTAWQQAQENALQKLAVWQLDKLSEEIKATDDPAKKQELINKAKTNPGPVFAKIWFYHKTIDAVPFYTVFMQFKVKE